MAGVDVDDDGNLAEDMMNVEALLGHNVVQMVKDNLILELLRTHSTDQNRVQRVVSELQRTYLKDDDLSIYMDTDDDDVLLALDNPNLNSSIYHTPNAQNGPIGRRENSPSTTPVGDVISSTSRSCSDSESERSKQVPVLQHAKLNATTDLWKSADIIEGPTTSSPNISSCSQDEPITGSFMNHRNGKMTEDSSSTSTDEDSPPEIISIHEEDRKRKKFCGIKSPGKKTRVETIDLVNSSPNNAFNSNEYYSMLEAMFPDADPLYLRQKFKYIENEQELNIVAATMLETNDYPRIIAGTLNVPEEERPGISSYHNNPSVILKPSALKVGVSNDPHPSTTVIHMPILKDVLSTPEEGQPRKEKPDLRPEVIPEVKASDTTTSLPQSCEMESNVPNSSAATIDPHPSANELPTTVAVPVVTPIQVEIEDRVSCTTTIDIPGPDMPSTVASLLDAVPKTIVQPSPMNPVTSSLHSFETSALSLTPTPLAFPTFQNQEPVQPSVPTRETNSDSHDIDQPGPSGTQRVIMKEELWAEKYSLLLCIFPQSDQKYLESKAKLLHDKDEEFSLFVELTLEELHNPPPKNYIQVPPSQPSNVNLPAPGVAKMPERSSTNHSGPSSANIPRPSVSIVSGSTASNVQRPSASKAQLPNVSNVSGLGDANIHRPSASNVSAPSNANILRPSAFSVPGPSNANVQRPSAFSVPGPSGVNVAESSGGNLPGPSCASLPGPSGANLPRSSSTNLPRSSSTNLPRSSSTNLPRSSSTNLPRSSSTNLPGSSSTNLPGPSGANLPGSSSTNLPGPSGITDGDNDASPWSEKQSLLLSILPDADPTFLEERAKSLHDKEEEFKTFVANALENKDYPTLKDYQRRLEIIALQNKYLRDFNIENFLEIVPEPFKYFSQSTRKPSQDTQDRGLLFLKRKYRLIRSNDITAIYRKNLFNLTNTCHELNNFMGLPLKSRRPDFKINDKLPDTNISLQFLQEVAFIENEEKIKKYLKDKEDGEQRALNEAREKGELLECNCCFDDEVLTRNIVTCPEGHIFCKSCVRKGAETKIGEGTTKVSCLTDCQAEFTLQSLQGVLKPTVFSKLAQRKQLEEIKAAGIEDLLQCPFCDFCNIPGTGDKIFRCLNPDCMKDSCIMCKEESHIPLRCDEVEKASEVKMRTYIEDKMTEALVRTCWKCQRKFVKIDGCNKMTCQCGALMCYICRQPVKDYSHFNGQGGDAYHKCPLFSDNNALHVEAVEKVAAEAKAELAQKHPGVTLRHDPTSVPIPREAGGRHPLHAAHGLGNYGMNVAAGHPAPLFAVYGPPPYYPAERAARINHAADFEHGDPGRINPHVVAAAAAMNAGDRPNHLPLPLPPYLNPLPPVLPRPRVHHHHHHHHHRDRARRQRDNLANFAVEMDRFAALLRVENRVRNRERGDQPIRNADAGLAYQADLARAYPNIQPVPPRNVANVAAPNGNPYYVQEMRHRHPFPHRPDDF